MSQPILEHRPLADIVPNPDNVRRSFDEAEIKKLAVSIATLGLIEPLVVQSDAQLGDGTVQLIAGERRWRALQLIANKTVPLPLDTPLDLDAIPVTHRQANGHVTDIMLAENLSRVDLSPIEEAAGYKFLLDKGLTQADVGRAVGKSGTVVSRRVKLLNLSPELRSAIGEGTVTLAVADKLATLDVEVANALFAAGAIDSYSLSQAVRTQERAELDRKLTKKLEGAGYGVAEFEKHPQGYGWACLTPAPEGTSWSEATYLMKNENGEEYEEAAVFAEWDTFIQAYPLPADDILVWVQHGRLSVYKAEPLPEHYVVSPDDSTDIDYVDPDEADAKHQAYKEKREADETRRKLEANAAMKHLREQHDIMAAKPPSAAVLTEAAFAYLVGRVDGKTLTRAAKMLNLDATTRQRTVGFGSGAKKVDYQDWVGAFIEAWDAATTPAAQRKLVYAVMLANIELMEWSAKEYAPILEAAAPTPEFDVKAWRAEYSKKLKAKKAKAPKTTEAPASEGDDD